MSQTNNPAPRIGSQITKDGVKEQATPSDKTQPPDIEKPWSEGGLNAAATASVGTQPYEYKLPSVESNSLNASADSTVGRGSVATDSNPQSTLKVTPPINSPGSSSVREPQEIKPHSSVIYTDLKVVCGTCKQECCWRYDEEADMIQFLAHECTSRLSGEASGGQADRCPKCNSKHRSKFKYVAGSIRGYYVPCSDEWHKSTKPRAEARTQSETAPSSAEDWLVKNINAHGWNVGRFIQFAAEHHKSQDLIDTLNAFWAARASTGTQKEKP